MTNTWTKQIGFPVLNVSEDGNAISIVQERFLSDGTKDSSDNLWDIPLTILKKSGDSITNEDLGIWSPVSSNIAPSSFTEKINPALSDWWKLNSNQAGFYLVNYSSNHWNRLASAVQDGNMNIVDRLSLLDSAFRLCRGGRLSIAETFKFSSAFSNDPEYLCWKVLSMNLRYYMRLFSNESVYPKFQEFIRKLYSTIGNKIGWNNNHLNGNYSENIGLFRKDVISILGSGKDKDVIQKAKDLFNIYINETEQGITPKSISADLRHVVLSIAASNGDEKVYSQIRSVYETTDFIEEKLDCLSAIGKVKCTKSRTDLLNWATFQNGVRSQDIQYVFSSISSDYEGTELAWNFIQDNWDSLNELYRPTIAGRIIVSVISGYSTEEKAQEIESFLKSRRHQAYERSLNGTLESIRIRASTYKRDHHDFIQWCESI